MGHDSAENGAKGARAERVVIRNGEMMFTADLCGETAVRADLPRELIAKSAAKCLFQIGSGEVAWQLHATASSSSMTR